MTRDELDRVALSTSLGYAFAAAILALVVVRSVWLTPPTALYVFDVANLAGLALAVFALRIAASTAGEGTAGTSLRLLFWASVAYLIGQTLLFVFRLADGAGDIPFPSIADAFFVLGQVMFACGLALYVISIVRVGLPFGGTVVYIGAAALLAGAALVVWTVLIPLWVSSAKTLGFKQVITTYVFMDLILLGAALSALRVGVLMRGGAIASGWIAMAIGFIAMTVGDVLYAAGEDTAVPFFFVVAYSGIAFGALRLQEAIAGVHRLKH